MVWRSGREYDGGFAGARRGGEDYDLSVHLVGIEGEAGFGI